jgi:hypothetical protein
MRYWRPEDGPRPERPDFAQQAEEFPGSVAIACVPPEGTIALLGFESSDDHPWAVDVTYATTGRNLLRVRTVRGTIDWPQRIRSVETLVSNMIDPTEMMHGQHVRAFLEDPPAPELPTSIVIDGTPVPATRMDLPNRSGIRVEWQGQHVFCLGEAKLLDALELRTGTSADFTRFMAEFEEFIARRRPGGQ